MGLLSDYRHEYSAPSWSPVPRPALARDRRRATTSREGGCPGNQRLTWFSLYMKHDADGARPRRALPAASALLHRAAERSGGQVDGCSPARTGAWSRGPCSARGGAGGAPFGRWRRTDASSWSTSAGRRRPPRAGCSSREAGRSPGCSRTTAGTSLERRPDVAAMSPALGRPPGRGAVELASAAIACTLRTSCSCVGRSIRLSAAR